MTSSAIVLLSGGLDSATCLALARAAGARCHALSFRYGQVHAHELSAAARVAADLGAVEHRVAEIDLAAFGGSALTGHGEIPRDRDESAMASVIPTTYVPARNTVFLAHALAWAEVLGADEIHIGVNAVDYSGYPDCRPEFIAAFQEVAVTGTRAGAEGRACRIRTPLIDMTKADIIRTGTGLGVDYSVTVSCYEAGPEGACGHCDACILRRRGFDDAGLPDPTLYR